MSVKTYSFKRDGEKKLSPHFKVREFRCKDGTDKILIESGLITHLEKVYEHFNCSRIDITSGYRTASHDKAVGGRGAGNHVKGKAVDFVAYDKNGDKIPSREIALYLEDIGVKGIGYRCGGNANATHMDINYRTLKWYGDEKKSMNASACKSFYTYFGVNWKQRTVTASALKLRADTGTDATVKYTVPKWAHLNVADTGAISKDGFKWVRVKYKGKILWAANEYLVK